MIAMKIGISKIGTAAGMLALGTIFVCALVLPLGEVFAQVGNPGGGTGPGPTNPTTPSSGGVSVRLENPIGVGDTIPDIVQAVIRNVIMPLGGTIAVIMIIYGGFLFVTARGSEDKLKDAKKTLTRAAIGTAILLGSWAIAIAIQNTVNQLTN